MASPSGSPRRGRTLALNGIPYETHPSKVLERLQAAGRLQRACTTTRSSTTSTSIGHSLAAQQRQQQQQQHYQHHQQQQQPGNLNESASIPGCPCLSQLVYSLKAEFSTPEAASKARDLLIAQPRHDSHDSDSHHFEFNEIGILPNFVLEEDDILLDIPAIISIGSGSSGSNGSNGSGCAVCCGARTPSPSPRSEDIHGRRTSAEGIDPTRKHFPTSTSLPSPSARPHMHMFRQMLPHTHVTHAKSSLSGLCRKPTYLLLPFPDLCVPAQHNGFSNNGNNPYYNAQHDIIGFSTSTTLSSGSSLASPHRAPSRLPHSRQGSYSTFSSVSARSSPSAPSQHLVSLAPPPPPAIVGASPPMETVGFGFSLPPFDSRDPFHPHHSHSHSHSGLQDGLLFDGPSGTRPKLPSAIPALGGYTPPAYLSHSRSSSYGQTPTATTYQAPFPFRPQNLDHREWGVPQRLHASAASSPSKIDANKLIPVAPAVHEPTREYHQQQIQQSQLHRLCHTPSVGEGDKQYSTLPVQGPTDALGPALASDNEKKLDFRAALTTNSTIGARPQLAAHNRSQSMGVNSRVNGPAIPPPTTYGHMRSSSAIVVGNNNNNAGANNTSTKTSGGSKYNGGHKRSKSSVSSTHSHAPSHKSAENQKTFAYDPHRGPRSTDWMLSPETLAARPSKDAKFAHMVALGLAKGRTKAGWAQARRPGKRDRDAAKRKLAEELSHCVAEVDMQAGGGGGGGTNATVEEVVEDMSSMAISGPCACVGTNAGAA